MSIKSLIIKDVDLGYGRCESIVKQARLTLQTGQITALLGPSGSGKSSLLRAIAGLDHVRSGQIMFDNDLWSDTKTHVLPENRTCGVVFQDFALFPHLTALKNVMYGLHQTRKSDKRQKAITQLQTVELAHRAKAYPHELSGGEQQRIALARALAPQPSVMLLDEPFSSLDRRLRQDLSALTASILRGTNVATFLVTHDSEEALNMADQIALIDKGHIIQTGTPEELYFHPVSEIAARLLGPVEVFNSRVENDMAHTVFGPVQACDYLSGDPVKILIRPEGLSISNDNGAKARIKSQRIGVGYKRVECRLEDERTLTLPVPSTQTLEIGQTVMLSLNPYYAHTVRA